MKGVVRALEVGVCGGMYLIHLRGCVESKFRPDICGGPRRRPILECVPDGTSFVNKGHGIDQKRFGRVGMEGLYNRAE